MSIGKFEHISRGNAMSSVNFEGEEVSWVFAHFNAILRANTEN